MATANEFVVKLQLVLEICKKNIRQNWIKMFNQ